MWYDDLKKANVSIHVIATGAGAGIQNELWEIPGSSAYLSGASFPYDQEEQEGLLGFIPEQFCSEESSVDLASAAYMKAYKFGGKQAVGVGLTASVASEKIHRGEHRVFVTVMTDDKVWTYHKILVKGEGIEQRKLDGQLCANITFDVMLDAIDSDVYNMNFSYKDNIDLAKSRFFDRPFFTSNGKRLATLPANKHQALMPGAYNPPHEGHLGTAQNVMDEYGRSVIFEVTAIPPHKDPLSVQELLKRAKLLKGHDRFFTRQEPLYLDKARAFPGIPIVLGADAMVRMLDPKWGTPLKPMFQEFIKLNTKLLIAGRMVGDKFVTCEDVLRNLLVQDPHAWGFAQSVMMPVSGRFDISSTELRNKLGAQ